VPSSTLRQLATQFLLTLVRATTFANAPSPYVSRDAVSGDSAALHARAIRQQAKGEVRQDSGDAKEDRKVGEADDASKP